VNARRYRRFARPPSVSVASRPSLWTDDDHLLLVDFNGMTESYRRVYWRDVQALVWYETPIRLILSILILLFVAGFSGLAFLARSAPAGMWVLLGFAAFFGLLLLINLARGPTCACFVQTATAVHRLNAIGRVRQAHRLEALASERVSQQQSGDVPPAPLPPPAMPPPPQADTPSASSGVPPPLPASIPAEAHAVRPPPLALDGSYLRLHVVAFATALASAVLDAVIAGGWNNLGLSVASMLAGSALMGLVIVGLVRARRLPDSTGLVRTYWFALVTVTAFWVVGYAHMMVLMITSPTHPLGGSEVDYLRAVSRLHGGNSTYMLVNATVSAIAEGWIGLMGLLQLQRMLARWRLLSTPPEAGTP